MFHATEALDGPVAAMVVGQQQPFGRNDLGRTTAPEQHDGIFERIAVEVINITGREFQPLGLHFLDVELLQPGQHPHPLIGPERGKSQRQRTDRQ